MWALAVRRAQVIGPLAEVGGLRGAAVDRAAAELGVSRRHIYGLLERWRAGEGLASDLIPRRSSGGRGRPRLPAAVEDVVREVLAKAYASRQKRSVASVHREIGGLCRAQGLPVPSRSAIDRRIVQLDPVATTAAREGPDGARRLQPAGGRVPPVREVLEQVQIDHTVVDVIVVDEQARLPIGRPYVTVAIDVFSRCVIGLVVTLEAPSALSAGLCLAHAVMDKRPWLERTGVEATWPMSGKPRALYLDNAAEFKSEALRRGCEQHGIELRYRPPGQPHYGGIVERVIGTMMEVVHELPGTTFSNPSERGSYDSEAKAVLTLDELERWLALAVASYHGQLHRTTGQTPQRRWEDATQGSPPSVVANGVAFLVDFLPVYRRKLTRTGFVLDHVHYFSDSLKPWIARRGQLGSFVLRRDPRDISRVWVLDPEGGSYVTVPYRTLSRPPVTVWEQRAAVHRLRTEGRAHVDEEALFRMVEQMRDITDTAKTATRKARRNAERRRATPAAEAPLSVPVHPPAPRSVGSTALPFEVIEQW